MTTVLLLGVIAALVAINVALWKFGFVDHAEHPEPVIDKPVMDARERKAILKRLRRWKEEGKISVEEYEHVSFLCDQEWDGRESLLTENRGQ